MKKLIRMGIALLGLAGSGSASMAVILSQTSNDSWIQQSARLLVFSKDVLIQALGDSKDLKDLYARLHRTIAKVENNLQELESERCSLDAEVIKKTRDCLKYLNRCEAELAKLFK